MHQVLFRNDTRRTVLGVGVLKPAGIEAFYHHVLGKQRHQRDQFVADKQLLHEGVSAKTDTRHQHQHKPRWCHLQIRPATKYLVNLILLGQPARAVRLPLVNLQR